MQTTWKPHETHGVLTTKSGLPDSVYAFPTKRKEPLTDARHVRNAVARFDQVIDVSDAERALAFAKSRRPRNIIMSIFRRRRGAISAFIRSAAAARPRPKGVRPSARAASCKSASAKRDAEREREREKRACEKRRELRRR